MTLSTDDLGNILDVIALHDDWDQLSEEIGFDVKELNAKVFRELSSQAKA